ncbi:hypothetical protein L9F63_001856, partial [Diploptera punctata]
NFLRARVEHSIGEQVTFSLMLANVITYVPARASCQHVSSHIRELYSKSRHTLPALKDLCCNPV